MKRCTLYNKTNNIIISKSIKRTYLSVGTLRWYIIGSYTPKLTEYEEKVQKNKKHDKHLIRIQFNKTFDAKMYPYTKQLRQKEKDIMHTKSMCID